jgi:hypothetical protein
LKVLSSPNKKLIVQIHFLYGQINYRNQTQGNKRAKSFCAQKYGMERNKEWQKWFTSKSHAPLNKKKYSKTSEKVLDLADREEKQINQPSTEQRSEIIQKRIEEAWAKFKDEKFGINYINEPLEEKTLSETTKKSNRKKY